MNLLNAIFFESNNKCQIFLGEIDIPHINFFLKTMIKSFREIMTYEIDITSFPHKRFKIIFKQ